MIAATSPARPDRHPLVRELLRLTDADVARLDLRTVESLELRLAVDLVASARAAGRLAAA